MATTLTPKQQELLKEIVEAVRADVIPEEFMLIYSSGGGLVMEAQDHPWKSDFSQGKFTALAHAGYIQIDRRQHNDNVTLLGAAYQAVDSNFSAPDTSFIVHLTPLSDVTTLDDELKSRVLTGLGAAPSDPKAWDSAVRTAAVVLEERLREVGKITDPSATGRDIVNKIFTKGGTLASKFSTDSERESYRDLYAGVVGLIRNPSAHRLIDPTPEEGGVSIVLIDLLLRKLESLR